MRFVPPRTSEIRSEPCKRRGKIPQAETNTNATESSRVVGIVANKMRRSVSIRCLNASRVQIMVGSVSPN